MVSQIWHSYFADDNTISVTCRGLEKLLRILENQSNSAINWFTSNNMIVKPNKFQSICLKHKESVMSYTLNIKM